MNHEQKWSLQVWFKEKISSILPLIYKIEGYLGALSYPYIFIILVLLGQTRFIFSCRMELKSFNIDVITVAPGGIKTNLANNSLTSYSKFPEWKFYKPFEAAIQERAHASQGKNCTAVEEFAEQTVNLVLRKNPPAWFSYGRYSTIFGILYYLPLWVRDLLFRQIMKCWYVAD